MRSPNNQVGLLSLCILHTGGGGGTRGGDAGTHWWEESWNTSGVLGGGPQVEGQHLPDSSSADGSPDAQGFIEAVKEHTSAVCLL